MPTTIREVVAVFDDTKALDEAVYALETQGFDRAAFSILASEDAVQEKLGHRYQTVKEVEDDPKAPRDTFFSHVSRIEADVLPAPVLASIGALMFMGGAMVPVLIAAGAGAALGAALSGVIHHHQAKRIEEQLARGGLLLWVNVRDAQEEATASKVLAAHSAHDVHVHEIAPE